MRFTRNCKESGLSKLLRSCQASIFKIYCLDFGQIHLDEIEPIVYRIEIDYKKLLKSGDKFSVQLTF